jgi:NO-binding membrane sensor protein with MHYT domain
MTDMAVDVHHFAFGPVTPVIAAISAFLGCLLGIVLTIKAQKYHGRRKVRLLLYGSVAIGVTGVWQANVLAMLGLDVPATVVRYDPRWVLASLGVALATAIAGLFIASYGRIGFVRLLLAGALLGGGVAGANYALLLSLRVGGEITYPMALMPLAVALAMGVASALLRFLVGTRRLGSALMAAAGMGVAICAVHYVAEAAVAVRVGATDLGGADMGVDPMQIALPTMVLGGVLIVMMWFFTVGTATRRDLRAIFDPLDDVGQIEPWMIEEVTARVALTPTYVRPTTSAIAGAFAGPWPGRQTPAHRPTPPGITPVWRVLPVGGRPELSKATGPWPNDRGTSTERSTNTRHDDLPTPSVAPVSPAPITAATAVPSANEPDVARQYIAPLPRRNARR